MNTLGINGNRNKRFIFIEGALLQPKGELSFNGNIVYVLRSHFIFQRRKLYPVKFNDPRTLFFRDMYTGCI
jgi:hypothetical protein